MKRRQAIQWAIWFFLAVILTGFTATEAMAQEQTTGGYLFGFGQYPGGTLHEVFQMEKGPDTPTRTYTIDIAPEGDNFRMTETIAGVAPLAEIQTGLGKRGAAAVAGARYAYKEASNIDMSPLGVLEEHNVTVEANKSYYLPDGASLVTGDVETIAGIDVIKGTFTHPGYPSQRVILGFADPDVADLLLFPVYIRREVEGGVDYFVQLLEFSYEP